MSRQVNIGVSVDSSKAVSNINTLKKAFQELNEAIEKNGKDGSLKIRVNLEGIDVKTFEGLAKNFSKISKSIDTLENSFSKMSSNSKNLGINITSISNITNRARDNTDKYSSSVKKASRQQEGFNTSVLNGIVQLEALRRGFSYLKSDYLSLMDKTFSVGIAGEMNIEQINALNESFAKLSTTVPKSAQELATAVDDLIRTGRSYDESRKIIEEVARLSVASGDDLKSTAQVVTKVMVSLGVNADRTVETLNSMHSTAIQTASDMGYLAEAYKNIAGTNAVFVASTGLAGEALDDYKQKVLDLSMASIGHMANLGLSASQTGTKIKQMFGRLVSAETVAKKMFNQEMILNNVQIGGELFNYDKLSQMAKTDLPKAVETMSKLYIQGKLSSQVLQKLFTARHFMELSDLLLAVNGNVDGFVDKITKGANYSEDVYKSMFNLNRQTELLQNNIKTAFQPISESGASSVTGFFMGLNELLTKMNTKEEGKFGKNIKEFMNELVISSGLSIASIVALGGALTFLKPIVLATGTAFSGLLTSMGIAGVSNPVGLLIVALGGLFYVLQKLGKQALEDKRKIADFFTTISSVEPNIDSVSNSVDTLRTSMNMLANSLEKTSNINIAEYIKNNYSAIDVLAEKYKDYYDTVDSLETLDPLDTELLTPRIKEMENRLSSLTNEVSNYRKELEKLQNIDFKDLVLGMGDAQLFYFKNILPADERSNQLKEFYSYILQEQKQIENPEDLMKNIYKAGIEKYGFKSNKDVDWFLKNIDTKKYDELNQKINETAKYEKELREEYENTTRAINERVKLAEQTQDKWASLVNKEQSEFFFETGQIILSDGRTLKGEDAILHELKKGLPNVIQSIQGDIQEEIKLYEDEVRRLYEDTSIENFMQNTERIQKLIDRINTLRIAENNLIKAGQRKIIEILDNDTLMWFRGLDIKPNMVADVLQYGHNKLRQNILKEIGGHEQQVEGLDEYGKIRKARISHTDATNKSKAKKNENKYTLESISYKKEELEIDLALAKIGKTKGEQIVLDYEYKLKTYKLNREMAQSEVQDARKQLEKLTKGEGGSIVQRLLDVNPTDTKKAQDILKEFEQNYAKEGTGDKYKALSEAQKTSKAYVKALLDVKKYEADMKVSLFNTFDETMKYVSTLNPYEQIFNYSGKNMSEYQARIKEIFETQKREVWETYGLKDTSIDKALVDTYNELVYLTQNMSTEQGKLQLIKELGLKNDKDGLSAQEQLMVYYEKIEQKYNDIDNIKKEEINLEKKSLELAEKKLSIYNDLGNLIEKIGTTLGSETITGLGDVFSSFGDVNKFQADPRNNFDIKKIGKAISGGLNDIKWEDISQDMSNAINSAIKHMDMGQAVGTVIGNAFGGGKSSQQAGALAGLATGFIPGLDPMTSMAIQAGASLIGGLFDKGDEGQEEAERKTKEANKIYNKNTEALQELSKRMSELSGGVSSLNSSLISSFSKIPTVGNIQSVTDAMTSMYKTMEKTRIFNEVAYQVTRHESGRSGFLGIGAKPSKTWTETIKISVNEMLRRYGFKGRIEDMNADQLRGFSQWLKNYSLGDSDNFSVLASAVEDYANALGKMEKNIEDFFYDTTMESFEGITSLQQKDLREQIEKFYKNLGLQIDDNMSQQIDRLAEQMSVMVTVMQDVRSEFISNWREFGLDAGKTFVKSMSPYIESMLSNISQIYYDVYFSDINKSLEDEFKTLSEKLIELKKTSYNLNWDSVANELSSSFKDVINIINSAKTETESFNTIVLELQKQALKNGLSLSEIFDLGLSTETQKNVIDTFKDALSSEESNKAFTSIGDMVGNTIGKALVNKLVDNMMGEKILEMSAMLDKAISSNNGLSFENLAGLASEAMSVGLMMEQQQIRLSALKDMFDWDKDINYSTQESNITYEKGTSSSTVYNVYVNGSVEAGAVIESDSVERLLDSITDQLIENLKVNKGIDLRKLQ